MREINTTIIMTEEAPLTLLRDPSSTEGIKAHTGTINPTEKDMIRAKTRAGRITIETREIGRKS